MSRKTPIDILIVDNEQDCRKALVNELTKTVNNYPLKQLYDFSFKEYNKTDHLIEYLEQENKLTLKTIAFIECFAFKNKITKSDWLQCEFNKPWIRSVIILENKDKLQECKKNMPPGLDIDFILKNNYTLAVCSALLEQFISNKS